MSVKMMLSAVAIVGALGMALPAMAQDKGSDNGAMKKSTHGHHAMHHATHHSMHHTMHHSMKKPMHHASMHRSGGMKGGMRGENTKENAETAKLNQEQVQMNGSQSK
jgi:hypothetical protein